MLGVNHSACWREKAVCVSLHILVHHRLKAIDCSRSLALCAFLKFQYCPDAYLALVAIIIGAGGRLLRHRAEPCMA